MSEVVERMLERTDYRAYLLAAHPKWEAEGKIENLEELVGVAREYETAADEPSLSGFLQDISLYSDQDALRNDDDAGQVTLMTLHNAKGLEFRAVFALGLEEGIFPHSRSIEENAIEEERRLFYVGMTRAKERLTLTHAARRSLYGRSEANLPSRFLDELPEQGVERERLAPASWSGYGAQPARREFAPRGGRAGPLDGRLGPPPDARRRHRHEDRARRRRHRPLRGRRRAPAHARVRAARADPGMSVEIRRCADVGELERAVLVIGQYFGAEPGGELAERFGRLLGPERMHAAFDGELVVGGAGAFPFSLSVPGGSVACAGTTVVGVSPTHRRRGVMRGMMRAHLDDAHERGDPVAALWASEETIYGRFGYGRASFAGEVAVPREHAAFATPLEREGTVRLVDVAEALDVLPPLWDALARDRPGVFSRSRDWWEHRALIDPPERRHGAGPKRIVVLDLGGAPAGYAIYRHRMEWGSGLPAGQIVVTEAIAAGTRASAELWRYLLDVDWASTITASLLPPDHPLVFLLAEPRRMRYRMGDGLWVRLVDVGAALAARTYADDADVVFEVRDAFCPWNEGRWSRAGRTTARADLALDVATLGSAYLGGVGFAALAQGGLVEELTPGATERADGAFRHGRHPWCPEIF